MKVKYQIIFALIFFSLLFNFLLSVYLIKQERVIEIKRLDEIIERTCEMIRLTNMGPLFDIDKEKVRLNIKTIFKNNAEIAEISLTDITSTIKMTVSREKILKMADNITKHIIVEKKGFKLADIEVVYTTYYLETRLNSLKLKMILLTLGLLVSNAMVVIYSKLQSSELKAGERRFHAIFNQTFQFIGLLQPDGRLIEMNQTALDQVNVEHADIVDQYFWDTPWWGHSREDQGKLKAAIQAAAQGRFMRYETKNRLADNRLIHIDFSIKPVKDDHDQIVLLITEGRDISERIRAADELLKAHNELETRVAERTHELSQTLTEIEAAKSEADAAARAKSEFLANMSHEIRTPMNGVIAAAELALKEQAPPKVTRFLEIINNSGHTLLEIINEILDFSKIEAGRLDLEYNPFNLKDIFDSLLNIFSEKTDYKGIELLVDIDPDTRMAIIGDQYRIQQILVNLVGNAYKFTPSGGIITTGVYPERNGGNSHPGSLTFFVEDTGVGIKQEHLETLFEPFTQEDASTTRQYGGTGLGLAICKQLIELMEGKIWVESTPGKGSCFYFTIRIDLQAIDQEDKLVVPDFLFGLQTLVIDDCTQSRTIMEKILQSFGIHAEAVSTGELALTKLTQERVPYGLVMVDQLMPELNGLQVVEQIRNNLNLSMPVILMGKGSDALEDGQVRFDYFLPKPITPSSLFDAILTVFKFMPKHISHTVSATLDTIKDVDVLRGLRVLVVEDNPTNQEIAIAILEEAGMLTTVAENGKIGVTCIQNDQFDMVLMDMQMPEMDGYEATRILRQDHSAFELPIIAMTANAMEGDREKCLAEGMNDYIAKPINQKALFTILIKYAKKIRRPQTPKPATPISLSQDKKEINPIKSTAILTNIPGIDVQRALSELGIDYPVLQHILINFYENHRDVTNRALELFNNHYWEQLAALAHSIKGSAANIRASKVQAAALQIEQACRSGQNDAPSNTLMERLEQSLNEVLAGIMALTETQSSRSVSEAVSCDRGRLANLFHQLREALDMSDPEEIGILTDNLKTVLDASLFKALEDKIAMYDYYEATALLKNIAESYQIDLGL